MIRKMMLIIIACSCCFGLILYDCAFAEKSFAQNIDDISAAGSYVYIYSQGDCNLYDGYPSYNRKYINGSYTTASGVTYHNNLGHGGCGIYTYAHAIQWLTSNHTSESAAISLLDTLINIDPEPYNTLEPLENYLQTLGITMVSRPTTEAAIVQHFSKGGVVILHPTGSSGGHYCLAISAAYGNIDGQGRRLWIHILDSSVGSTTKRINYSAYGFVSPHGLLTPGTCYYGCDYWIPVEAYVNGFTATWDMKAYLPSNPGVAVTGVTIDLDEVTLRENQETTLTATISPSNATNKSVSWSSNNSAVAIVTPDNDRQATVKAIKGGTAVITCTTVDGGKTATCAVTVNTSVTGLTLSPTSLQLEIGATSTLTATIEPSNATDKTVHWDTKNSSIATVSNGVVSGISSGTTEITAMAEDGGFTKTCVVTVVQPATKVTKITLSKSSLLLKKGDNVTLTATIAPSNATNKNVTWSSDNTAVATVSSGTVKAIGSGQAVITCTAADGSDVSAPCTVTVEDESVPVLNLPEDLTEISQEAFAYAGVRRVIVANAVQKIGTRAFAGCSKLTYIYIPATTTEIAGDAFTGVPSGFVIHGSLNSYAQTYASQNGYSFVADDACKITFNANGGTCNTATKTIRKGSAIGALPAPTYVYHTFNGWYTAEPGGTKVTTSATFSSNTTLYAHWDLKGFGDWSAWSTTPVTGNDNREVQTEVRSEQTGTKTTYSYSRYAYKGNTWNNVSYSSDYPDSLGWPGYWQYITLDYPLTQEPKDGYNDRYTGYFLAIEGATLDWVQCVWYKQVIGTAAVYSDVTYYRYRDRIQ